MGASARQIDQNPLKGLSWIGGSAVSSPGVDGGAREAPDSRSSEVRDSGSSSAPPPATPKPEVLRPVPKPELPQASSTTPGRAWVPRFAAFELTVPFHAHQVDRLESLARAIMRGRAVEYRAERITKNTVLRAWLEVLACVNVDLTNLRDEADLVERFRKAIGRG